MDFDAEIANRWAVITQVTEDLRQYYPSTAVLFGSMARCLAGIETDNIPKDIDIMVVGNNPPTGIERKEWGYPVELHRFQRYQFIDIAKSLRYDTKPIALSKLYSSVLAKQHARNVIAACMLLGPSYNDFGFEQIEVDTGIDERDYSIHRVLIGKDWWQKISAYARERRGPLKRFSDKLVRQYEFDSQ
jgi:hypothetical protein